MFFPLFNKKKKKTKDAKLAKTNFHCVTTTTATTNVVATTTPPIVNAENVVNPADFLFTNSLDHGKLIYGLKLHPRML